MDFVLVNKSLIKNELKTDGYYKRQNKKYHDMFDLTPEKQFAKIFENIKSAQLIADSLNKGDWNFAIEPVN